MEGKNESIEAEVVVLVIYGQEIKDNEKELAEDSRIQIWDENDVEKLLNKDDGKIKEFIFDNLPLREQGLGEAYSTKIDKLVWKPYLEGDKIKEEVSHEELLLMIKQRIRRELYQEGSSKKKRQNHINFFEQVEKSGLIRSSIKVKSSKRKFDKISEKLDEGGSPFSENREKRYNKYLKSVEDKYEDAKEFYLESEGREQAERLIKARLKHLMKYGSEVAFSPRSDKKPVNASRSNAKISLDFEIKKAGDLETIRWILTKEGSYERKNDGNRLKNKVSFKFDDIDDATDAVIRIIDEYKNWDLDKIRLVDNNKDEMNRGRGLFSKLLE
jgi:hypothetical protein